MAEIVRLVGGGVADLAWHGPERRRAARRPTAPAEYDLAVVTPGEFEDLVGALRAGADGDAPADAGRRAA